jgi:outer membrane protein assembly factor BamB
VGGSGCQSPPPLSEEAELQQLWRQAVLPAGAVAESIYPLLRGSQAVVSQAYPGELPALLTLQLADGQLRWRSADGSDSSQLYYNMQPAVLGNRLILPRGSRTTAIDFRDGQVLWGFVHQGSAEQFIETLDGRSVLQAVNDWEGRISHFYRLDVHTGKAAAAFSQPWPDSARVLLRSPAAIGRGRVLFTSIAQYRSGGKTVARWHILNLADGRMIAEGEAYPENTHGFGVTKQPVIAGDLALLMAYDQFICLDHRQGEVRWRTALPRDMLSSAPLVEGQAVYCALEDGYLYKLSLEDGRILWKSELSGTPSRLACCGNHLFVVGGGDGMLYTFDTADGRRIRRMAAPNHYYRRNEFFRRFIGADCRQGRLLLFDGHSFRCYSLYYPGDG